MATDCKILSMIQILGTTSATIGTTTTHAHGGGTVPRAYLLRAKGNGVVYEIAAPDNLNISVRGSIASLAFEAILFF